MNDDLIRCRSSGLPEPARAICFRKQMHAPGRAISLTQRDTTGNLLTVRGGYRKSRGEKAGSTREALSCVSVPAVSPMTTGRSHMRRAFRQPTNGCGNAAFQRLLVSSSAALALATSLVIALPAHAQDTSIIHPGSTAVTGFSGTYIPGIDAGLPPGVDPVDETFIDPERATLRIFDVSALGGPPSGQLVNTPPPFEVLA